jgi:hypothetical protein
LRDHPLPNFLEACKERLNRLTMFFSSHSILLKHLTCAFHDLLQCRYDDVIRMDLKTHRGRRLIQLWISLNYLPSRVDKTCVDGQERSHLLDKASDILFREDNILPIV